MVKLFLLSSEKLQRDGQPLSWSIQLDSSSSSSYDACVARRLRSTTPMANAVIAIRVPCELSMIVGPRRHVAYSLESCDAFYVKSLLLIILNVTTAGNLATNLLAKYRGNIVASNSFQQQCCLVYDGLNGEYTEHCTWSRHQLKMAALPR